MDNNYFPKDNVQQYIDRLKNDLDAITFALAADELQMQQSINKLAKHSQWADFLKKMKVQLALTNQLGLTYINFLKRTIAQGEKVEKNAVLGVEAVEILVCQMKLVMDCTEVWRTLLKQLTGSINCNIPQRNKPESITAVMNSLKDAVEEALNSVREAVNALLAAFQLQEDLQVSLSGEMGFVYQVNGMLQLMVEGKKQELPDFVSCRPPKKPVFPMEFYRQIENDSREADNERKPLEAAAETASKKYETGKAKKEALTAAYNAALSAKSSEVKK